MSRNRIFFAVLIISVLIANAALARPVEVTARITGFIYNQREGCQPHKTGVKLTIIYPISYAEKEIKIQYMEFGLLNPLKPGDLCRFSLDDMIIRELFTAHDANSLTVLSETVTDFRKLLNS